MKRLWVIAIAMFAPVLANAANLAIPPQGLGASLQELAKQSGVQIIFFSKVVEGHDAPALNGTFTPEAALDRLLAGTNLVYRPLNERTIEVTAGPSDVAVPWTPLLEPKPAAEPNPGPNAPLDEVEISAERAGLSELRAAIGNLERQFYTRYNQLNTNRRYDVILCRSWTETGTHLVRRVCGPAGFVPLARVGWMDVKVPIPVPTIQTPTDPEELRAYQQNMVEVVRKYPELLELVKQRSELVERYRAARTRR